MADGKPFRKGEGGRKPGSKNKLTIEAENLIAKRPGVKPLNAMLEAVQILYAELIAVQQRLITASGGDLALIVAPNSAAGIALARRDKVLDLLTKVTGTLLPYTNARLQAQWDIDQGFPADFDLSQLSNRQLMTLVERFDGMVGADKSAAN
jgi:hypothetical protein